MFLTFAIARNHTSSQQRSFATSRPHCHSSTGRWCSTRKDTPSISSVFCLVVRIVQFYGLVRIVAVCRSMLLGCRRQRRIATVSLSCFDRSVLAVPIRSGRCSSIALLSPFLEHRSSIDDSAASCTIACSISRARHEAFSPKGLARRVRFLWSHLILIVARRGSNIVSRRSIQNTSAKSSSSEGHPAASRTHSSANLLLLQQSLAFTNSNFFTPLQH